MKRRGKLPALLLIVCTVLGLAACGKSRMKENDLLQIGDEVFTRQEAMVFLLSQHSIYTADYGEKVWSVQLSNGSFESYVKEAMLDYLERLFLTDCAAKEAGIVLSVTEKAAVDKAAGLFFAELNEETIQKTGLTREICVQAYSRYARAQIYFRKVLGRTPNEVSDEEARAVLLQIVSVRKSMGIKTAQSILEKITEGASATEAIRDVAGAALRRETVIRGTYPREFDTVVFALKKDQWSPVISLADEYALVQCLSVYEAEATALNKAAMEKEKRESELRDAVLSYAGNITLVMNPAAWEDISLGGFAGLSPADFYRYTDALRANY